MRRPSPTALIVTGATLGGLTLAVDLACLLAGWPLMPVQIHMFPVGTALTMMACGVLMHYVHDLFTLARKLGNNTTAERHTPRRPPPRPRPGGSPPDLRVVPSAPAAHDPDVTAELPRIIIPRHRPTA